MSIFMYTVKFNDGSEELYAAIGDPVAEWHLEDVLDVKTHGIAIH